MKILIVYYSRTGYTARVSQQLGTVLGATLCPITEAHSRSGWRGYLRCLIEAVFDRQPEIGPLTQDPAQFDLVIIGTPIWGWHLASPVRSFVVGYAQSIKQCAFFCTMGGSGDSSAFTELQRRLGRAPSATLALTDAHIDQGLQETRIGEFVAKLQSTALGAAARPPTGVVPGTGIEPV